jgi:hypothetical protein
MGNEIFCSGVAVSLRVCCRMGGMNFSSTEYGHTEYKYKWGQGSEVGCVCLAKSLIYRVGISQFLLLECWRFSPKLEYFGGNL